MKKYRYITLLCIALVMASCNSMLDLKPETDPSDASMWSNANAFEKAANNFYTWLPYMQNRSGSNGVYSYGLMDREEMGDMRISDPSTAANTTSNSTYTKVDVDAVYQEYFKQLRAVNLFLKNAASYAKPDEIKKYVAEAQFFRAYYSYLVFVDYGPLQIIKDPLEVNSEELYGARATRDEFADFIISDLEASIGSGALPLQSAIQSTANNGRITLGAAQALLARVCLFEGTWQKYHFNNTTRSKELLKKAYENATLVMSDNSYALFYNSSLGVKSYRYMFILESTTKCNPAGVLKDANKEYIFRNRFDETIRQSGQNNTHRGRGMMISRKMLEMALDKNGNATTPDYTTALNSCFKNRDPRISTTCGGVGELYWNYEAGSTFNRDKADSLKMTYRAWGGNGFLCSKFGGERSATNTADGFDVPIIRLAEVYLIYAEAKCEYQDGTLSDDDLNKSINKLRTRVSMPNLTNAVIPTGSTLLNEIRRERNVELFLEGFRYDDLRRWKTAEVEMSKALEGIWMGTGSAFAKSWTLSYPSLSKSYSYTPVEANKFTVSTEGYTIREAASARAFQQKHYLRPLPTKQIELNPNLEQNPEW
ncbi:RagB/SusD family nutrient uptake outer membrane protein [Parabacteroides sp. FAFU027]|uniref:RagB/SusD family nutrient uptake outer membrane protein n=1 Tax=Parabacteroides sp. FAFU027 TaxID=2922715 RepID=UPI001FAE99C1|nr:RagB/SusD family nutrient uptake outer membrane protein [Parabacteroides sp. FAFU027]